MGPLSTTNHGFSTFLEAISNDDTQYRFAARNFLLDEGVMPARCDSYRSSGAADAHADCHAWRGQHEKYLYQQVYRPGPGSGVPVRLEQSDEDLCPETFRFVNPNSPFAYSDKGLHLIRTEELSFIARYSGVPEDRLKDLAQDVAEHGTSAKSFAEFESSLRTWTKKIELRPVFAAFWEDLADLFGTTPGNDVSDWANRLRDRLGLAHYDPAQRGSSIDVLVFRYEIGCLAQIREFGPNVRALVSPTVLDGNLSYAFCPAPAGAKTGYTLDLSGANTPRREVLHPTLAFRARHLWRIGTITEPVDLSSFETLRGLHLLWLQGQTGVTDYAVDTDGDLL